MGEAIRWISIWLFLIGLLSFTIPSAHAKTFRGRVIDADTGEPIEGAVVVAHWHSERPSILGDGTELEDVKEILTDKNGNWMIVGKKGRSSPPVPFFIILGVMTFRYTKEPEFIIFKPGYCSWPNGFSIDACKGKIKPKGNDKIIEGKTIELPKLTNREDRLRAIPGAVAGKNSLEKQKKFIRLINEEERNLGLSGESYK